MPDLKQYDEDYRGNLEQIAALSIAEQVQHWAAVLEKGEFHRGSPYQYNKTDYEVYEQLLRLGKPAIPFIQEQMNNKLKSDTVFVLQAVISSVTSE